MDKVHKACLPVGRLCWAPRQANMLLCDLIRPPCNFGRNSAPAAPPASPARIQSAGPSGTVAIRVTAFILTAAALFLYVTPL